MIRSNVAAQPSTLDLAKARVSSARSAGDASALADALDALAGELIAAQQWDAATQAAGESLETAKSASLIPAAQRAALRLAQISERSGNAMQAELWRQEAADLDPTTAIESTMASESPTTTEATAAPAAAPVQPTTITVIKETVRTPRTLVILGAVALLAWWYSHRRSMKLLSQKRDLERRQRVLRTTNLHLQQAAKELQQIAVEDALTSVLTRKEFVGRLDALLKHAEGFGKPVQLCVFDLDHFKRINDTQGHMTGDAALKLVVGIAREHLRSEDLLGRFGGDEFMIAGMDRDMPAMTEMMERIRAAVQDRAAHSSGFQGLSVSMGVAEANPAQGFDRDHLFHRADSALYVAKRGGRNRVVEESAAVAVDATALHPLRSLQENPSNA